MPSERSSQPSTRSHQLTVRIRILYFAIPALMGAIIFGLGSIISGNIADEFSQRMARQYSIEAASNFLTSTNPHFVLMQQIARSTTISRWLANENDPAMKAMAFEEIMGYAIFSPNIYLMFTVYETLYGYDFHVDSTLTEFLPWGRLAGGEVSQWFFDTRDAYKPFILNIQRTRPVYDHWYLYIWSNHRMYYQGRFVGVVTVGSPFDPIFYATFSGFNKDYKRGYIIDQHGAVRVDSAMLLEIHTEGLPSFPALPEAGYDTALLYHITRHLQEKTGGIFLPGHFPFEAIPMSNSIYRYASIAPIIGTNWSVVVLSNHRGIFGGARYSPLIFSTIVLLLGSVLAGNVIIRRMAVTEKEQENNEFNQVLIDFAPYVIGLWDDQGNLQIASPQSRDFFGVSDPKMIADDLYSYSPELQPCGTPTPVKAAMYAEKAYKEGYARFEWLHKRTDGELVPAECIYKIYKNKGKEFLLSYTIDLRTVKAAEGKQREANEMVNLLLDASPMFIEIWDDNHNLLDCNNRVMNLFELSSKSEFIARYDDFSPEYQSCGTLSKEKHRNLRTQALRETYAQSEWMHLTSSGEELPVEVTYVCLPRQDKHIIVVYNHDLREVKKALAEMHRIEIAEASSRAKTKFLARMSHEIRTPISAVLGISEIQLHNTSLPLEIEEAFAKIYSSSNTLLSIVNDILDLSKVEAGKMEIVNNKYEVASLLSDIAQLNLAYMGSKKLIFNIDVDENIPTSLIGDELRIKQSLNNLLSNAFKYTDVGTINMTVHGKKGNQDNYLNIVITIQDTGRGMNEEQLKALFDEYSRFHEKDYRFETGTGLGMSITYALIKMMNAEIDVTSKVGRGTTITIELPQQIGSDKKLGRETVQNLKYFNTEAFSNAKRLSVTPEPMPYGRVLVVDDIDANIYVAAGLMSLYQLQIDSCSSGPAAIEKIRAGYVYDIIFMDQMMPDMSGTEATAIIRSMNYTSPIVALTADAFVGQAEKYLQNGFDGFLSKPIQTVHLNALLHKFVKDMHPEAVSVTGNKNTTTTDEEVFLKKEAKPKARPNVFSDNYMETSGINDKIRRDIVRNRKNIASEITDAIAANDLVTAQRHAHSLKGLIGNIGEKDLFDLAEKIERALRDGEIPTELIQELGLEMERVLVRLRKHLNEPEEQT